MSVRVFYGTRYFATESKDIALGCATTEAIFHFGQDAPTMDVEKAPHKDGEASFAFDYYFVFETTQQAVYFKLRHKI